MSKSLYLVAPKSTMPHSFGAEVYEHWGYSPSQLIGDVALTTVAALAPPDFEVAACDEALTPVDFDTPADFVGITGKITQSQRMLEIAETFRRRGKTVLIGGPYASLSPSSVRESCDILVLGEVEDIAEDLFGDLRSGQWKDTYLGGRPDLARSPLPRWELYPHERTRTGAVQTSRGCPFDCEFCDVIQYLGRKQRHKPVTQVLGELDALYDYGYGHVFLSDDNFTVYRSRAKELAGALRDWNLKASRGPVFFSTQASIDAARDEELLRMCADARLTTMFIGLETPNEESLRETKKHQNLLEDPIEQVRLLLAHGIYVISGMMVGFDSDGPDIFERQFEFAMANPIPIFSLGMLTAPEATPLYARMRQSGRLIESGGEVPAVPWDSNIVPAGMTPEQMSIGMKWLANRLYRPEFFGERLLHYMRSFKPVSESGSQRRPLPAREDLYRDTSGLMQRFLRSGAEEMEMALRVERALAGKPELIRTVRTSILQYAQIRCLYDMGDYWDPVLGRLEAPPF